MAFYTAEVLCWNWNPVSENESLAEVHILSGHRFSEGLCLLLCTSPWNPKNLEFKKNPYQPLQSYMQGIWGVLRYSVLSFPISFLFKKRKKRIGRKERGKGGGGCLSCWQSSFYLLYCAMNITICPLGPCPLRLITVTAWGGGGGRGVVALGTKFLGAQNLPDPALALSCCALSLHSPQPAQTGNTSKRGTSMHC